MSDIVIKVENLSKQYRLGTIGHGTLYQDLQSWWARVWGKEDPNTRITPNPQPSAPPSQLFAPGEDRFWALQDVNLEVNQGEIVGIIGRNGAGKSTLLKIMSQVTAPTKGTIKIKGRVASLLEVGTGFHQELTGRENIYLNGTILGMTREEINRKFVEIVDFAEVDKFLDTPVKRYSSGMQVRLAFAVAAHLEPEILLVDEVLAVGDAAFQKKCLGKMGDVAKGGRTVLFVSHNMATISALCSKAIVLKNGLIEFPLGDINEAVGRYLMQVNQITKTPLSDRKDRQGEGRIRITHFVVCDRDGYEQEFLVSGQQVEFRLYYQCVNNKDPKNIVVAMGITSYTGVFVTMLSNQVSSGPFEMINQQGFMSCTINKLPLAPGSYTLNLIIRQNDIIQDWIQEAAVLTVESGDFYGTGRLPPPTHGGVFFEQVWTNNRSLAAKESRIV